MKHATSAVSQERCRLRSRKYMGNEYNTGAMLCSIRRAYLTVTLPIMPASKWPGTKQA